MNTPRPSEEVPRPCQGARTLPPPTTVDEGHSLPREPPQALPDRSAASGDTRQRQGKAPPIESFSGEASGVLLDDWLPSLERAAAWNGWPMEDKLMQLPGYLKGRALQEWRLLGSPEQRCYTAAIEALRRRLDPGSKTVAAQEFRHSLQRRGEVVSDFIQRLEKMYHVTYGKDDLAASTRDALLYGQLYDGLQCDIMHSPAVSGSQGYRELCMAAKAEERRLEALKQRQRYSHDMSASPPGRDQRPLTRDARPQLAIRGRQSSDRTGEREPLMHPFWHQTDVVATTVAKQAILLGTAPSPSERAAGAL